LPEIERATVFPSGQRGLHGVEARVITAFEASDGSAQPQGEALRLDAGDVEAVSPTIGDLHRVHNAHADRVSISIHVYGANIGAVRRHTYPAEGGRKPFVSGYSNTLLPNLWDRSAEELRSTTSA